jgi:cyclic pyranopterin phosphate synthase
MPLLDVIVGYDCNLYCDYCTISPAMRQRSLSAPAIVAELRRGRRDGYQRVSFTGGEPTIRADLLPLIREARALGYDHVKVQTNGLLLAEPANLDRLLGAGVDRVHLSIHTHRVDRYDALVRRAGAYEAMVSAVESLAERDVDFVADVILKTDTFEDLPDAIAWLQQRGVRKVDLWFVSLTDHNADNLESMPKMTEVVPTLRRALSSPSAQAMEIRSLHIPRCLLGDLHPYAFDPAAQGVRVVTPDATFDLAISKLTGHLHVPACRGCRFESACPGIRDDYLARYGDEEFARARGQTPSISPRAKLPVV